MQQKKRESWKMSFITKLGLYKIIEDKFIYQPPKQKYQIKFGEDGLTFYNEEMKELQQLTNIQHRISIIKEYQYNKIISHVPIIHFSCNSEKVIIFSHSNAVDLGDAYKDGILICETYKVDVICYDYSGYGISSYMKPSENGISNDLFNVLALASNQYDYVYLWGFSIGSAPTVNIASQFGLSGVILQAPLASLGRVIDNRNSFTSKYDKFENEALICKVTAPVLIFHGINDTIIGINHSEQLYSKCQNPFSFIQVEGAGHNDLGRFAYNTTSAVYISICNLLSNPKATKMSKNFELKLRFDNLQIQTSMDKLYQSNLPNSNKKEIPKQKEGQACSMFCIKY